MRQKFPENRILKQNLISGDYAEMAKLSGHTIRYIGEVFNGARRMNDIIKMSYIAVLRNRKKLNSSVSAIAQKSETRRSGKPDCGTCSDYPTCTCGEASCPYFSKYH